MITSARAGLRAAAVFGAAIAACGAVAQDSSQSNNRVAAETDWSIFVEKDPQECWAVSAPKETVNTKDGRVVAVKRGDILLFVYYRPARNEQGVVSFTGGYPFAEGSTVKLEVGDSSFDMFTEGEWAWPATESDDSKITTALKRGTEAVLTARSARGTQTKDTFSLLGFTAALEKAEESCKG